MLNISAERRLVDDQTNERRIAFEERTSSAHSTVDHLGNTLSSHNRKVRDLEDEIARFRFRRDNPTYLNGYILDRVDSGGRYTIGKYEVRMSDGNGVILSGHAHEVESAFPRKGQFISAIVVRIYDADVLNEYGTPISVTNYLYSPNWRQSQIDKIAELRSDLSEVREKRDEALALARDAEKAVRGLSFEEDYEGEAARYLSRTRSVVLTYTSGGQ